MPTSTPVRDVMTAEVVVVRPDQSVREAAATLLDRGVDGAPVVGDDGAVVGMLSTGDLIVQEREVHLPPVVAILGVVLPLGSQAHFDSELHKVLGSQVHEVMEPHPVTIGPDASVGDAAALMGDRRVSRLPVVDSGRLLGVISRGDIVRELLRDLGG